MKSSNNCKKLIAEFEGCRLKAYKCPSGIWTIGIGHTGGVSANMTITQEQADKFFAADISRFEAAVNKLKLNLNQNQFDALVSFTYNAGEGCLATLCKNRTLPQIAEALLLYNKSSSGQVLEGLIRRRKAERALFLTACSSAASNKYKVIATVLNVRSAPNTSCNIIGYLSKNCTITAVPVGNGWAKYNNGFVSMQYLSKL